MVGSSHCISVFGSWRKPQDQEDHRQVEGEERQWSHELSKEIFEQACRQVAVELARSGNRLLVASDSPSTVDYHMVKGILDNRSVLDANLPLIRVIRSGASRSSKDQSDCSHIYEDAVQRYPDIFEIAVDMKDTTSWDEVHDYMLEASDKILILGGGQSSYRIGVKALADGTPIVPIGAFGAAGAELLRMLEKVRDQRNFPKYVYRRILGVTEWRSDQLNASLYALGIKKDPAERHKIFINYRRSDSTWAAGAIYERLCNKFSEENVFQDVEDIEIGNRFDEVIMDVLDKTSVFLVIIGPTWLTTQDADTGRRRLDLEGDFVRREIEVALRDNISIIPVCVEGAPMPPASVLPDSISELERWHAMFIASDNRSRRKDLDELTAKIEEMI